MGTEWTLEAVKAEIDYRQRSVWADREHVREVLRTTPRKASWWTRLAHWGVPKIPEQRKVRGSAA